MHSIVTTFRGAVIKVEVANFCAAMDTLIDQDGILGCIMTLHSTQYHGSFNPHTFQTCNILE